MPDTMPCRVINLIDRPERLAHMTVEFDRLGVEFEPLAAINPANDPANPRYQTLAPRKDGRGWLNSEIGCLLSHHELWREIGQGEARHVAVFEDDVVLSDQLGDILRGDFPPEADIVKLDTNYQILYLHRQLIPMKSGKGGFRKLRSDAEGSGAYVISRSAAAKVADALGHFDFPIDNVLFSPRLARKLGLTVYQAVPAPAIQGVFLDHLKSSAIMASNRVAELPANPQAPVSPHLLHLLFRIIRRAWRQLGGLRQTIPFAGVSGGQ